MENIPINIHFFRSTPKGRIDYRELLEYFQALPNFDMLFVGVILLYY